MDSEYTESRLTYCWYVDYDRKDEYPLNPSWAANLRSEEREEDAGGITIPSTRVYDRRSQDDEWIESTKTYDLRRMI